MKWLLALAGLFLGGIAGGFETALKLMLGGFLIGGAIDFFRAPKRNSADAGAAGGPLDVQIRQLEAGLQALAARVARLEHAPAGDAAAGPSGQPAEQPPYAAPVAEPLAADQAPVFASEVPEALLADARAEQAAPVPPRASTPSPLEQAWRWFWGGNTLVKVGIVILFFGVAFLIKYAADHSLLPIELRLAAVTLGAIALLVFGRRLTRQNRSAAEADDEAGDAAGLAGARRMRAGFGLLLQGAAIGILYLTVFGAFRLYGLLPGGLAFALMIAIVALSATLAVLQDSLALAAFGAAGGFLAPILASTGGGSHVGLFSFYALLNAGIFAIAWFRSWRVLNLLGFVFTFAIGAVWGATAYRPEHLWSTEPFLVLFFLFYVAIAIVYAFREAPRLTSYVDGTLVFGTPVVAFSLQAALMRDTPFGAAFSAVAVAAFYLALAAWLARARRETHGLLFECFLALGVVFATLAVPLALDGRWTAGVWALEGAAVVWVGLRQQRLLARAFGYVVMVGAAVALLADHEHWRTASDWPILNAAWLGGVLIALSALFVARSIDRHAASLGDGERVIALVASLWGGLWWLGAGVAELDHWLSRAQLAGAVALLLAFSAAVALWASSRAAWPRLAHAVPALMPLLAADALYGLAVSGRPFVEYGWAAWPLAFLIHYGVLRRYEARAGTGEATSLIDLVHCLGVWLITLLAVAELRHLTTTQALSQSVWSAGAAALPLIVAALWLTSAPASRRWPVRDHARAYLLGGLMPIVVLAWFWIFYADARYDGYAGPIAYVPLLNALDLMHVFAFLAIVSWWHAFARLQIAPPLAPRVLWAALGAAGFFWLNAILLRTIHHWGGVPYRFDAMMRSMLVQAALSIFWTLLAIALMVAAHRRRLRALWIIGAALMGAVVAKLFLVDLSNVGGIERIVSFIVVGLLMLAVGYFSPLPPRQDAAKAAA